MHGMIQDFLIEQEADSNSICISCIVKMGIENNMRVEMDFIEKGIIMFTLIDEQIKINNQPFIYNFLNKYQLPENES